MGPSGEHGRKLNRKEGAVEIFLTAFFIYLNDLGADIRGDSPVSCAIPWQSGLIVPYLETGKVQ